MSSIADSWRKIEDALERRAPKLRETLAPPATRGQLSKLEAALGQKLPRGFAASLRVHNGMRGGYLGIDRLFNYEALLSTDNIAHRWSAMKAQLDAGTLPKAGCGATRTSKLKNDVWWRPAWIPVTDADGDGYWLDLDPTGVGSSGQVFYFYGGGARPRRVVAATYDAWLEKLASRLSRAKLAEDGLLSISAP